MGAGRRRRTIFTLTVSPVSSTAAPGTAAPPYSFTVAPLNGFNGAVTLTSTPPTGFTCAPAACTAALALGQNANALQFTQAVTLPAGPYTLSFTGTSGSLTHTVTATLTLAAPPPPILPLSPVCAIAAPLSPATTSSTGFAYTGDPNPTGLLYDPARNRILVTNLPLNEVDVISAATLKIAARLPVPSPWASIFPSTARPSSSAPAPTSSTRPPPTPSASPTVTTSLPPKANTSAPCSPPPSPTAPSSLLPPTWLPPTKVSSAGPPPTASSSPSLQDFPTLQSAISSLPPTACTPS